MLKKSLKFRKNNLGKKNKFFIRGIFDYINLIPDTYINFIEELKVLDFEVFISKKNKKIIFQGYKNYSFEDILIKFNFSKDKFSLSSDIDKNYVLPFDILENKPLISISYLVEDNYKYIEKLEKIKDSLINFSKDNNYSLRIENEKLFCEISLNSLVNFNEKLKNLESICDSFFTNEKKFGKIVYSNLEKV